jgi:hypothetical protein
MRTPRDRWFSNVRVSKDALARIQTFVEQLDCGYNLCAGRGVRAFTAGIEDDEGAKAEYGPYR